MIINVLFIASFTKVFISTEHWKFLWFDTGISTYTVLYITIAFSWLGMRSLAGYSWIMLMILAACQMTATSDIMGGVGAFYVLCPFISLGMQIAGGYINMNLGNLKEDFFGASRIIKSDVNQSIETTKNAVNSAIGVAKMAAGVPNIPNMQSEPKQIVDSK